MSRTCLIKLLLYFRTVVWETEKSTPSLAPAISGSLSDSPTLLPTSRSITPTTVAQNQHSHRQSSSVLLCTHPPVSASRPLGWLSTAAVPSKSRISPCTGIIRDHTPRKPYPTQKCLAAFDCRDLVVSSLQPWSVSGPRNLDSRRKGEAVNDRPGFRVVV
jgi:hypothetical protein